MTQPPQTPWHFTSVSDGAFSVHRGIDGPDPIAHDIPNRDIAQLIAAAPAMFAALELCEGALADLSRLDDGTCSVSALNATRDAMVLARGEA